MFDVWYFVFVELVFVCFGCNDVGFLGVYYVFFFFVLFWYSDFMWECLVRLFR